MVKRISQQNIRDSPRTALFACVILAYSQIIGNRVNFSLLSSFRNSSLTGTENPFTVLHYVHFTRWLTIAQELTWLQIK